MTDQSFYDIELEKNKIQAVKNVLGWMGFKQIENIDKKGNLYIYRSIRNKIKKFLVFSEWKNYFKWEKENKQMQKKMYQCLGFKVVLLK